MIKIDFIETTYDYILKTVFGIANPIKKSIMKTHCKVHKFINIHALNILKNDKYLAEYNFFSSFILDINQGAVWADQDFKSSNHFYNPYRKRGLYGRKSAMDLGIDYYQEALGLWAKGEFNKSLFYLGATLHIIQDMTIPQHANIRLLDDHHQYESYVKHTYEYIKEFQVDKGTYLLDSIEDYIRFNSRVALKIYRRFKKIPDDENRFYRISRCGLPLAERTTAGAMIMFYNDIFSSAKFEN
ncbi:zinc dependent phospholipase C family protein [Tissierella carlieri]|uniref:Phospholipase C n=1 Tax=Tissierella carlieri TaxID=689904 RepID=A0ABT1SBI8_9FIRM|nr:zinc dependent phospholipase C family protein [Tissierella carlieri]